MPAPGAAGPGDAAAAAASEVVRQHPGVSRTGCERNYHLCPGLVTPPCLAACQRMYNAASGAAPPRAVDLAVDCIMRLAVWRHRLTDLGCHEKLNTYGRKDDDHSGHYIYGRNFFHEHTTACTATAARPASRRAGYLGLRASSSRCPHLKARATTATSSSTPTAMRGASRLAQSSHLGRPMGRPGVCESSR